MLKRLRKIGLIQRFAFFILAVAIISQFVGKVEQRERMIAPDLGKLLPKSIPGWTIEDKKVAETPEMQEALNQILNYDSAIFRIYKQGDTDIAIYVSYWLPGKVPENAIDAHTPDICWVHSGWEMKKMAALPDQHVRGIEVPIANVREFSAAGQSLHVVYWHISTGKLRTNKSVLESSLTLKERTMRRAAQVIDSTMSPPGQQIFIRVSTNKGIYDELRSEPLQACLDLVARSLSGEKLYSIYTK